MDDFTTLMGESEARGLLELLRLAIAGRIEARNSPSVVTAVLLGSSNIIFHMHLISFRMLF